MFSSSEVVELVLQNNVTHASERQHGDDDYLNGYLVPQCEEQYSFLRISSDSA